MKENLCVRKAVPADVPIILGLIKELAEYEKLVHELKTTEQDLHQILFGNNSFVEVLIAEYNNQVAGYALFFHNFSTFVGKPGLYLEDLYVKPELRSKGIGKILLEKIISIAKERNCGRVEWSVLDWNTSAIEFYKSRGAISLDEWTIFRLTEDKF